MGEEVCPPVALSGTLDNFSLGEVLRLLAQTAKSGTLHVDGDYRDGAVTVAGGRLTHVEVEAVDEADPEHLVFELLRNATGEFRFVAADGASSTGGADTVVVLVEAERRLSAWRGVEGVIGSLASTVELSDDLEGPEVVVNAPRWRVLAAVGDGRTVGEVAAYLGWSEVQTGRAVRDLVEAGLLTVVDLVDPADAPRSHRAEGERPVAAADDEPDAPAGMEVDDTADGDDDEVEWAASSSDDDEELDQLFSAIDHEVSLAASSRDDMSGWSVEDADADDGDDDDDDDLLDAVFATSSDAGPEPESEAPDDDDDWISDALDNVGGDDAWAPSTGGETDDDWLDDAVPLTGNSVPDAELLDELVDDLDGDDDPPTAPTAPTSGIDDLLDQGWGSTDDDVSFWDDDEVSAPRAGASTAVSWAGDDDDDAFDDFDDPIEVDPEPIPLRDLPPPSGPPVFAFDPLRDTGSIPAIEVSAPGAASDDATDLAAAFDDLDALDDLDEFADLELEPLDDLDDPAEATDEGRPRLTVVPDLDDAPSDDDDLHALDDFEDELDDALDDELAWMSPDAARAVSEVTSAPSLDDESRPPSAPDPIPAERLLRFLTLDRH